MLRLSIRGNLHVCWGSERRNATRPTRRNGRNIEFSEDPTRIVPCDAVAIAGKLVQNNGIELCAPDRCWILDSRMNVCRKERRVSFGTFFIGRNSLARASALLCWIFWTSVHAARTDLPLVQVEPSAARPVRQELLAPRSRVAYATPFAGGARRRHAQPRIGGSASGCRAQRAPSCQASARGRFRTSSASGSGSRHVPAEMGEH